MVQQAPELYPPSRHTSAVMFRPQVLVALVSLVASFCSVSHAQIGNLVISNDDGWATAQIRAQFEALTDADYSVCTEFFSVCSNGMADPNSLPRSFYPPQH